MRARPPGGQLAVGALRSTAAHRQRSHGWRLRLQSQRGYFATSASRRYRVNRREEDRLTAKKSVLAALGLLVAALALVAAGCGGDDDDGGGEVDGAAVVLVHGASSTRARAIRTYLIASDLPLQGSSRTQTEQMSRRSATSSSSATGRPATTTSRYQSCDDATAQAGEVGLGQVLGERQRLRRERRRDRRHRHVQLGLCRRSSSRC